MWRTMGCIVSSEWLKKNMDRERFIVADCRFVLGQPEEGRRRYREGHLPGAFYVDLEEDMSGPKGEHGGRHPLPDLGAFALKLGSMGIDEHTPVVAYDEMGGGMAAARFWWMLHFLGHPRVYILNGGLAGWTAAGYELETGNPVPEPRTFTPRVQSRLLVSMEEVRERLGRPGTVLIDSREPKRYRGEEETIDPKAGHIPGAVNRFWKEALRPDGRWKDAGEQRERFADLDPGDEVIVYCGSGVTACPNVAALYEAGFSKVRLYAGSWSDWISHEENPVATGEE